MVKGLASLQRSTPNQAAGTNPLNVDAMAIISTESLFRPWYQRALERQYVVLLWLTGWKNPWNVTVGVAQARLSLFSRNGEGILGSLFKSLSYRENYLACIEHLGERRAADCKELADRYTGGATIPYLRRYERYRQEFCRAARAQRVDFITLVNSD